jgi:DNA polymerase-1
MLVNKHETEDDMWRYNGVDCIRTREVGEVEQAALKVMGLEEPDHYQQSLFLPVLKAMIRGVRIDTKARDKLAQELQEEMEKREQFFREVLGHDLNPRSSSQMAKLFYDDLRQPPIKTRAKKGIPGHLTCNDEALAKIAQREPLIAPIIQAIQEYRSLGVFLSTFVLARLDVDGRMRCSYNISGTETFRLSSSENVFGSGGNLQNLPKGDEKGLLPNIRKLYIPDPGMTFFDTDLDRADLQVVVWEADEPDLKAALKMGVDMHLLNAYLLADKEPPPFEELVENHPRYGDHRTPYKKQRQLAKTFIHGSNYGGSARTMAATCGLSIKESERFQQRYFSRYPGLKKWHQRVEEQLRKERMVTNKFGYRRYYFERTDSILPEALAWIPQSTVGIYINRIWILIEEYLPEVQVLLQVHDSLAGQFPTSRASTCKHDILQLAKQVIIPYDDPLIIPLGIKMSNISWGDVE